MYNKDSITNIKPIDVNLNGNNKFESNFLFMKTSMEIFKINKLEIKRDFDKLEMQMMMSEYRLFSGLYEQEILKQQK